MSFLGEVKRRKVFQVAVVYAVVAWLLIQIVATVEEPLNLPRWFDTAVIVLLAVGFPITLIMSWGFNLTEEGLVRDRGEVYAPTKPRLTIELLLIGVLVIAVGWLYFRDLNVSDDAVPIDQPAENVAVAVDTTAGPLPNSIAVLPFENLSPDPDNAYFAAGIHESTLDQLAKIRDLTVISRTSVMQFEDDRPSVPEIARALRVETVMEGSVRYANGRVLITAQLIDGRTDAHLWSDSFNRDLADVFAVQADVARHIAEAMQIQLLPEEQARIESRPTESIEAYRHYLYALGLPEPFYFPDARPPRIESLKTAIAADPGFAEAYAELAWAYYTSPADRDLAYDYAQRAMQLDPTSARAHYVIGMRERYFYNRLDDAKTAFRGAIEFGSDGAWLLIDAARQLAELNNEYSEAIRLAEKAISIEPNAINHNNLGFIFMRAGDLDVAIQHVRAAMEIDPGIYIHSLNIATIEYLKGNLIAARENLDRAAQIMAPGATLRADYIPYLYGLLGDATPSEHFLAEHGEVVEDPSADAWETLGWAALGTRDRELALPVWQTTIDGYINDDRPVSPGRITRFRDNWLNDPILDEPEFVELRRRLGFEGWAL